MKVITIKVASPRGHDVMTLDPAAALEKLQALSNDGKWVYVDSDIVNPRELSVDDLIKAETVLVANNLQGG